MNNNVEICLVSPPARAFSGTVPAGLLYIHAWLTENNINTRIVDVKEEHIGIPISQARMERKI